MYYIQTAHESNREIKSEWEWGRGSYSPQPTASSPSFIMVMYTRSLRHDLIFQTHVRCGSLGKAFTINKQTLFTCRALWEAHELEGFRAFSLFTPVNKPHATDIYETMEVNSSGGEISSCLRRAGICLFESKDTLEGRTISAADIGGGSGVCLK